MVKRSTWILIFILALAVIAYFLINEQSSKASKITPTPTKNSFLFSTAVNGILQSLRIYDNKGIAFRMQRDLSNAWVVTAPIIKTADQGLAGAAESQVDALSIETVLKSPPALGDMGLEVPAYTMEFVFVSGSSHKIEVGNMNPIKSGYYIRYDGSEIYIISQSGIDALLNLLKAPPFPATATPEATISSMNTPIPQIESPTP